MSLKNLMVLLVFLGAFVMVIVLQGQNVISVTMHPTGQVTSTDAAAPVATVPPLPAPVPTATPAVIVVPDQGTAGQQTQTGTGGAVEVPVTVTVTDNQQTQTGTGGAVEVPVTVTVTDNQQTQTGTGGAVEVPVTVTVTDDQQTQTGIGGEVAVPPLPETTAVVDPQVAVEGSIEYIDDKNICVRAANPDNPTTRPFVSVAIGGQVMASARVAANGLVQFDYAMLKNWYNGGAAAERPYQVAVTVIDPETKEARPVWETNEFLTPDYDLTKGEVEVTNWMFRRTARGKGTLTVWMKSERAGRAAYRLTGPAQTAARVWWRRPVTAYKGTGVLARNEGSDVFTTQLKDFPVEYRDYPRLFVAQGENYKRLFRVPYADDCYYGNGAPAAAVAQTTVADKTETVAAKLSAD